MGKLFLAAILAAVFAIHIEASEVRLFANQTNDFDGLDGIVEVMVNGSWSFIDADDWDLPDAIVTCRNLGFLGLGSFYNASLNITLPTYQKHKRGVSAVLIKFLPTIINTLQCYGRERKLKKCILGQVGSILGGFRAPASGSVMKSVAAISCTGFAPVRLSGGGGPHEGRVEVFYNGSWGSVCDDYWGQPDGNVVCKQLGYPGVLSIPGNAQFGGSSPSENIWIDDANCTKEDFDIRLCKKQDWSSGNCEHSEDASVVCKTPKNCPILPGIANGRLSTKHTSVGTKVRFTCRNSTKLVGMSLITCQSDGTWNSMPPVCVPMKPNASGCKSISISNGRASSTSVTSNQRVSFECDRGYTLVGPQSAFCSNGVLDMVPTCLSARGVLDMCLVPRRDGIQVLTNHTSVRVNTTLRFSCLRPWLTMVGYSVITCVRKGNSGEWNGPIPQCIRNYSYPIQGSYSQSSSSNQNSSVQLDIRMVTGVLLGVMGIALFAVIVLVVTILAIHTSRRKRCTRMENRALNNLSAPLVNASDGEES